MFPLRIILSLIFIGIFSPAFSQNDKKKLIDSLNLRLAQRQHDTIRILLLNEAAIAYMGADPEKAKADLDEAVALSAKLKYTRGLAKSYQNLGVIYHDL